MPTAPTGPQGLPALVEDRAQALPPPSQPMPAPGNPHQQLRQARTALNSGRLEEAEAILNSMNTAGVVPAGAS